MMERGDPPDGGVAAPSIPQEGRPKAHATVETGWSFGHGVPRRRTSPRPTRRTPCPNDHPVSTVAWAFGLPSWGIDGAATTPSGGPPHPIIGRRDPDLEQNRSRPDPPKSAG